VAQLAYTKISFLLFDSDLSASKLPSNFNEGSDEGRNEGSSGWEGGGRLERGIVGGSFIEIASIQTKFYM
jgi:hypothetical protein